MTNVHLLSKIGQYALIADKAGRLLLLARTRSKTWSLPGGRLNADENWDTSFLREIKEKTNLKGKNPKPFMVNIIKDPYQTKHCVYFCLDVSNINDLKISKEHNSFRWIEKSEIDKLNIEDNKVKKVIVSFFNKQLSLSK